MVKLYKGDSRKMKELKDPQIIKLKEKKEMKPQNHVL